MSDWLLANEAQVRLGAFMLLLALLLVLQKLRPLRVTPGGWRRAATNVALVVIGTAILRFVFPLLAFDLALRLEASGAGLMQNLSPVFGVVVGVLLLDMAIYWQHRFVHSVPWFWRLHRVHHADTEIDVTTALRFHPLEIVLSMLIKLGIIYTFGINPLSVLLFEVALSAGSLFTHANIALPPGFERRLRWLLVTPDMHRIHHCPRNEETDSNFGFQLSLWDRIFGSYRDQPNDEQATMTIGLHEFRDRRDQTLKNLLLNPFRTKATRQTATKELKQTS